MMMKQQQQQQEEVVAMAMVVVVVLLLLVGGASAASCNAGQLVVCSQAILTGAQPSASCCSNLKAAKGCFCQFAKNPQYGRYVSSPNARKTLASCGVTLPRC